MPKIAFFDTRYFYSLKGVSIDLEHWQTLLGLFWQKRKESKRFDKNHGLTPLENAKNSVFQNSIFL